MNWTSKFKHSGDFTISSHLNSMVAIFLSLENTADLFDTVLTALGKWYFTTYLDPSKIVLYFAKKLASIFFKRLIGSNGFSKEFFTIIQIIHFNSVF